MEYCNEGDLACNIYNTKLEYLEEKKRITEEEAVDYLL
jgi:hypothetical protein